MAPDPQTPSPARDLVLRTLADGRTLRRDVFDSYAIEETGEPVPEDVATALIAESAVLEVEHGISGRWRLAARARRLAETRLAEIADALREFSVLMDRDGPQPAGYLMVDDVRFLLGRVGEQEAVIRALRAEVARDYTAHVEAIEEAIYTAMREHHPGGENRPWVPSGNSDKQYEARSRAHAALRVAHSTPAPAPADRADAEQGE